MVKVPNQSPLMRNTHVDNTVTAVLHSGNGFLSAVLCCICSKFYVLHEGKRTPSEPMQGMFVVWWNQNGIPPLCKTLLVKYQEENPRHYIYITVRQRSSGHWAWTAFIKLRKKHQLKHQDVQRYLSKYFHSYVGIKHTTMKQTCVCVSSPVLT